MNEDQIRLSLPVIKVTQPIGDFYVGSMSSKSLVDISFFDMRRLNGTNELDDYLGIQRELNNKRVEEIKLYANSPDATFPTAIVLAVEEACVQLDKIEAPGADERFFLMTLSNIPDANDQILYRQIARVIDGQHRIKGLYGYDGPTFELNVSIFVGADISDQASIFATVNLAQTKVNKSLVYDLFELSQSRSPEKVCHDVAVALDRTEGSPFYKKIKRLGKATEGRFGETLSQATVVQGVMKHICANRMEVIRDRQIGKKGQKWPPVTAEEAEKLVLRLFFVREQDVEIVNLVWDYFEAVSERWPEAWKEGGKGLILNKTNGFDALMRFFKDAYLELAAPGEIVKKEKFLSLFQRVKLKDSEFTRDNFVPGSSGATALYNMLKEQTGIS
jgi:DGQHR domain-containing protein